jgi:hypothetical protein
VAFVEEAKFMGMLREYCLATDPEFIVVCFDEEYHCIVFHAQLDDLEVFARVDLISHFTAILSISNGS